MRIRSLFPLVAITAILASGCTQPVNETSTFVLPTAEPTDNVRPSPIATESSSETLPRGPQILAHADADLDIDGFLETLLLHVVADGSCRLTISGISNKVSYELERILAGPGSSDDFLDPNQVDSMRVVPIGNDAQSEYVVALQFSGMSVGEPQLVLYRVNRTDGISLGLSVPYAVDTGIVTLSDANTDGLFEQKTEKKYVVRYDAYDLSAGNLHPEFLRADAKMTFDRTKAEEVIRAWLYYRYNQINDLLSEVVAPNTREPESVFFPFPSSDGSYLGISFTDASRDMYMGLPSARIDRLEHDKTIAIYRISDFSEYSDRAAAGFRLKLRIQPDATWLIEDIQAETPMFVRIAIENGSNLDFEDQPVFLTQAEIQFGFMPLLETLADKTGIGVKNLIIDGDRCTVNLEPSMTAFFNQGSAGARMRVESLVRTMLGIPGIQEIAVEIDGKKQVEMDHYSFDGIFMLADEHMLRLDPYTELPPLPEEDEQAALFVSEALHTDDITALSRILDPISGLRLSRNAQVNLSADPVFDRIGMLSFLTDPEVHLFFRNESNTLDMTEVGVRATKELLFGKYFAFQKDMQTELVRMEASELPTKTSSGFSSITDAYPGHVFFRIEQASEEESTIKKQVLLALRKMDKGYRLSGLVALPSLEDSMIGR